jgi:hypothetical protein
MKTLTGRGIVPRPASVLRRPILTLPKVRWLHIQAFRGSAFRLLDAPAFALPRGLCRKAGIGAVSDAGILKKP